MSLKKTIKAMNSLLMIAGAVVAAGGIVYYMNSRKKGENGGLNLGNAKIDLLDIKKEQIEGELHLNDVIASFRDKKLDRSIQLPFIAQECKEIDGLFKSEVPAHKDGYVYLFKGAYNEKTEQIECGEIIYCKGFDMQLREVLKNEPIVVLQ